MTIFELYDKLIIRFKEMDGVEKLLDQPVAVMADTEPEPALMPWNYVPFKDRRPEYRVTADLCGTKGEAYTEKP